MLLWVWSAVLGNFGEWFASIEAQKTNNLLIWPRQRFSLEKVKAIFDIIYEFLVHICLLLDDRQTAWIFQNLEGRMTVDWE